MILTLSLIRNAKAVSDLSFEDKLRPLNEIGITRTKKLKMIIQNELLKADAIYSSPAVCAQSSATILLDALYLGSDCIKIVLERFTFELNKLESLVKNRMIP